MLTGRADTGGGPEHLLQLSRHLPTNFPVYIAAPREEPYWARYAALIGTDRMFELPHRSFSWPVLRQLERWCRKQGISIVHSHGRAAGAYSRLLLQRPERICVHTQHGSLQFKSPKDILYWIAEVILSRRTDHIIAVSHSEGIQLRRGLFLRRHVTVIPNGVVESSAGNASTAPQSRPLRIVHVTRFVPQKNSSMVLSIMEALRDHGSLGEFHVDMLGDGPERRPLEMEAAARGLKSYMTFHGAQPSILPFLTRGFCLLTTSRWEGMPLAVLEAMSSGLPVIASNTAGNNDVVSPRIGRLFELDSPASAAAHLLSLAADQETWAQLSAGARTLAREAYSVDRMARDTASLYERLLAANEPSEPRIAAQSALEESTLSR